MDTEPPVVPRESVTGASTWPVTGEAPSPNRAKIIPATCELHRGPVGYANLAVRKSDGTIVLDPHAVGCCVIRLDEAGARALRDALTDWLG